MTADESTVLQDEALPGHDEHSVEEETKIGSWFRATNADQHDRRKQKPNEVFYFTNRLEIGLDSVYPKLEQCSHILNMTEGDHVQESYAFQDQKLGSSLKYNSTGKTLDANATIDEDDRLGYITRVKVTGLDKKGRECVSESEYQDEVSVVAASIKLINIPSMFDLGTSQVNPCDE